MVAFRSPPSPATRPASLAGLAFAIAWLGLGIPLLGDYGPTWDAVFGDYRFGEGIVAFLTEGDAAALDPKSGPTALPHREPHPDFSEVRFGAHQLYPLASTLSAFSCRLFWTELGWLPALEAHHLPLVLFTGLLLFLLVRTTVARFGLAAGLAAGLFLVTAPRFFGHGFNNLKDVPETALYSAAVLAGWVAFRRDRDAWWILTGTLTALALAQKANALFLPVHFALFFLLTRRAGDAAPKLRLRHLIAASLAFVSVYLAVSPQFWSDPTTSIPLHFGEILSVGNTLFGGAEGPAASLVAHGPLHVLWTTPVALLGCATIGLACPLLRRDERLFLGLAIALPIGRTLLPGMRSFDGVRHFLEFLPPLCLAAGVGAVWLASQLTQRLPRVAWRPPVKAAVLALFLLPGALATARVHPNGICWFNGLIGGLEGAQRAGLAEATDYWGNSLWQGLDWLDANAEEGAAIMVPTGHHVARCAAPVKLRADLRLCGPGDPPPTDCLYVMTVTRKEWYPLVVPLIEHFLEPVYELRVQGAPVLRIHRLDRNAAAGTFLFWRLEAHRTAAPLLKSWLRKQPERALPLLESLGALDADERLASLRTTMPADLFEAARPALLVESHR